MRFTLSRRLKPLIGLWAVTMVACASVYATRTEEPPVLRVSLTAERVPTVEYRQEDQIVRAYALKGRLSDALAMLEPELKATGWQRIVIGDWFRGYRRGDTYLSIEPGLLKPLKGSAAPARPVPSEDLWLQVRRRLRSPWLEFKARIQEASAAPISPQAKAEMDELERRNSWEVAGVVGQKTALRAEDRKKLLLPLEGSGG